MRQGSAAQTLALGPPRPLKAGTPSPPGRARPPTPPRPCEPGPDLGLGALRVGARAGAGGGGALLGHHLPAPHHHPERPVLSRETPKSTCSDRAQPTPNAPKPQASLGGWAPRAPGTGGGGPRGPGAPFQRPENGNCAKRISKSGRAQSPPAYIKPQEPARPPADSPPGGEQSAGPWPGRPGVGTTTDPLTKGLA